MSKRYRRVIAVLVGLTSVFGGIGYGLSSQERYAEYANQSSAYYAKQALDKVTKACLNSDGGAMNKANCLREEAAEHRIAARDKQREYDELIAQQQSALWTMIMGIAALIGMALSVIGVALVLWTFRATQEANSIASDTAKRQLRAYVGATRLKMEFITAGKRPMFKLTIKNFGSTPALRLQAKAVGWLQIEHDPKPRSRLGHPTRKNESPLQPGQEQDFLYYLPATLNQNEVDRIRGQEIGFIYEGIIRYRDIYGRRHFTLFRYHSVPDYIAEDGSALLVPSSHHNACN